MPVQVKPMIAEAFIRLSKQKNIDKITVKDLVEACGISRQTFYYHFHDVYDLMRWIFEREAANLAQTVREAGGDWRQELHTITDAGREFLYSQRDEADAHWARLQAKAQAQRPPQIQRAIENFKLAVHLRLQGEALSDAQAHAFAAVLDTAAQQIEKI